MIQKIYAEIELQAGKHSISELCMVYGVSRSGYYKWLQRSGKANRYEQSQQILDSYVNDIHAHHPMMGYRSIRDSLVLQFGWLVSDPSVWKSMKRFRYWEKDSLYDVVAQSVHYFNYIRPVRKLNGKPPALFKTELVA